MMEREINCNPPEDTMERDAEEHITPLLILIFGASGSGKTTLLRELRGANNRISIHQKVTDRKPKKYDSEEIRCVNFVDGDRYAYIYRQYGYFYGIEKTQIDKAFVDGKDHFLICNDIDTIKQLKEDYGHRVKTIFLLFNAPRKYIETIQQARGITDDQLELRLAKIGVLSELFLDNSELFDGVILNRVGAPLGDMVSQVEGLLGRTYLDKGNKQPVLDKKVVVQMLEAVDVIRRNLEDLAGIKSDRAVQKDYVFILMAMIKDPLLDDSLMATKRAATSCGLRAERVDNLSFTEQITDKVLGSIRCAQFIVADLTHDRPNVYYEIGYAHAFRKPTVLTARRGTQPHFDIQGYPIIFYESSTELEVRLKTFFESYRGNK